MIRLGRSVDRYFFGFLCVVHPMNLLLIASFRCRERGVKRLWMHTMVCGSFVRAYKTHPAFSTIFNRSASSGASFSAHATKPPWYMRPFMPIHSLTLIGSPCNGPVAFLNLAMWASNSSARARACCGSSSEMQLAWWVFG